MVNSEFLRILLGSGNNGYQQIIRLVFIIAISWGVATFEDYTGIDSGVEVPSIEQPMLVEPTDTP